MWGDGDGLIGGQDTFVFKDNLAADQTVGNQNFIHDFNQSQHDVIKFIDVFDGATHITSFEQLVINDNVIQAGADQVTLVGFTGTLTVEDFLFA
jgi:hypothetical protein